MASPPDPAMVPTVTYESPFCIPLTEWLRPPAQRKAQGLLSGSSILGTVGHRLQPIYLDTTCSLQWQAIGKPYTSYQICPHHSWLKRRDHQPNKLNPGVIHDNMSPHLSSRGWARSHHMSTCSASPLGPGHA
jgi:hypothetical protein